MVVISKSILKAFIHQHPDAENAINDWYEKTKKSDWKHFAEIKTTFNTTDSVGNDRYVFDIKGNQYRLIALIIFSVRTVFILFVGTHSEYNQVNASTIKFKN